MTAAEADQYIIQSRRTLHRYAELTRTGIWPVADLALMQNEVSRLEEIAIDHPVKAEKVYRLAESWGAMMDAVRGKLH